MSRLESGPVRGPDDWAGIFLRGDDALHHARVMESLLMFCKETQSPEQQRRDFLVYSLADTMIHGLKKCDESEGPVEAVEIQRPPLRREGRNTGVRHKHSKLTPDLVREIRALWDEDVAVAEIVRRLDLDVSRATVYKVGRRASWKTVPEGLPEEEAPSE